MKYYFEGNYSKQGLMFYQEPPEQTDKGKKYTIDELFSDWTKASLKKFMQVKT